MRYLHCLCAVGDFYIFSFFVGGGEFSEAAN